MKLFSRLSLLGASITAILSLGIAVYPATAMAATSQGTCGNNLQCVQAVGNADIDKRIVSLNTLIEKAQDNKHLLAGQITPIVNDANANIHGLRTLRSTLDGETVIANARQDVKNIFVQYRIYAVVLPRDYHEIYADHMTNIHDTFVANEGLIETIIQNKANKGINVTQAQQQYQDLVAKVNDAGTQLNSTQTLFSQLVPANYPGTNQTLVTIRANLKQARTDLQGAYQDLKSIRQELGV